MTMLIASRIAAGVVRIADILDINGHSAGPVLHNRFVTAGLILYTAAIVGAILYLGRRRIAGIAVALAGACVGALLLARMV